MSVTREQVMTALLGICAGLPGIVNASRRNPGPERLAQQQTPSVFLLELSETYARQSPGQPPKRTLNVMAIFYTDTGTVQSAVPTQPLNAILDAFDAALAQIDVLTGRFTLGGLVYSCMVSGTVDKAPGDITGKSLASVPVEIILP